MRAGIYGPLKKSFRFQYPDFNIYTQQYLYTHAHTHAPHLFMAPSAPIISAELGTGAEEAAWAKPTFGLI
jgi:hypothetical protein